MLANQSGPSGSLIVMLYLTRLGMGLSSYG